MDTYLRSLSVSVAALLFIAPQAHAQGDTLNLDHRCTALMNLSLPGAKVVATEAVRSGTFHEDTDIDGKPYDHRGLPAFCRVRGEATPTPDSHIGFEVWLPITGWNGKLHMVGNGAYSDRIYYQQMASRLRSGDVAVATDTGHKGGELSFGDGHPERIADWGHRAVHESAVAGKAVATGFYGFGPRLSYFSGCSTGGHQALQEAERYPNDFDGIIAGDPGNDRTNLNLTFLWHFLKNHRKGDNSSEIVPAEKLRLVKRAVVAACDALDGVSDGVVNDPRQCKFDVASLTCQAGADPASCLTPPQVEAVKSMYQAPRDARTGQPLYADFLPGSEGSTRTPKDKLPGWSAYWANPRKPDEPQRVEFFRQWAFNDAQWDWWSFDWGKDIDTVRQKVSPMVDATSTDLSAFHAHGGKLIVFMGWDDPVGAAQDIIQWFEKLGPQDYAKLYMVPGMWHCAEGTGATNFSTATRDSVPPVSDARHDMAVALQDWVENKEVPQEIVATRFEGPDAREGKGPIAFQRPLCSWPLIAKYNGGPTDKAESFTCRLPDAQK